MDTGSPANIQRVRAYEQYIAHENQVSSFV